MTFDEAKTYHCGDELNDPTGKEHIKDWEYWQSCLEIDAAIGGIDEEFKMFLFRFKRFEMSFIEGKKPS